MTFGRFLITIITVACGFGCGASTSTTPRPIPHHVVDQTTDEPTDETTLPNHTIVKDESMLDTKRSVEVQLHDRVEEWDLSNLAAKIKQSDPKTYERTFIQYVGPGPRTGWAYATTHFNPDLEVKMFGYTKSQFEKVSKVPLQDNAIGAWIDESPNLNLRAEILKKGHSYQLYKLYKDGSETTEGFIFVSVDDAGIQRFKNTTSEIDYWLLHPNGRLEVYDNDGLIQPYQTIVAPTEPSNVEVAWQSIVSAYPIAPEIEQPGGSR